MDRISAISIRIGPYAGGDPFQGGLGDFTPSASWNASRRDTAKIHHIQPSK